jgi:glyoxylase-like metal-dependent hydrolase (beta-lactamase superfamily II)
VRDLFFLTCGALRSPLFAVGPSLRVSPLRWTVLSITVGVVVRDDGDIVLVDAGLREETFASPARVLGPVVSAYTRIVGGAGDAIAAQLRAHDLDPARVTTIVATHLHYDHVGGVADFPNAEIVCTDRELAAFRDKSGLGYVARDLARTGRVRTIALVTDPSYGFPASFDLFEDGELVLLDAHGHTKGSLAVAMRGEDACYVHVGDAAYGAWEYGLSPSGPSLFARLTAWNRRQLFRTYGCIRACEADPRRPVIVPSHDHDVFMRLPRTPRANAPKERSAQADASGSERELEGGGATKRSSPLERN